MLSSEMVLTDTDGTSARFVCDLARDGTAKSAARTRVMIRIRVIRIRTVISHRPVMTGDDLDQCPIELDGDARLDEIDGHDEASLGRFFPDEEAFESGERTLDHANAIALTNVRVEKHLNT